MIFKQIDEILSGQKTQTRRVVKFGEGMYEASLALTAAGNVKWAVGKTYAVQPGRGKPGIERWRETEDGIEWQPIRIRILAIRQERLQDITEDDAKAEGVADVEAYRALWQAINGKTPGARWDANPTVFVLEFELVRERSHDRTNSAIRSREKVLADQHPGWATGPLGHCVRACPPR